VIYDETQLWLIVFGGSVGSIILIELVRRFIKARPCWFFNHQMRHLSIEKRIWPPKGICHRCNEALPDNGPKYVDSFRHDPHIRKNGTLVPCYVTKWICRKNGCGEMGIFCVGDEDEGAWTIQHGEIVPDDKEWSKWQK
jgi:hypothetical protein